MKAAVMRGEAEIRCPACNSEAYYKYGRTKTGKQRFVCLMCRRQFVEGGTRAEVENRPTCPECGAPMYCYRREEGTIRFRCSKYPTCRTYIKQK